MPIPPRPSSARMRYLPNLTPASNTAAPGRNPVGDCEGGVALLAGGDDVATTVGLDGSGPDSIVAFFDALPPLRRERRRNSRNVIFPDSTSHSPTCLFK